MPSLTSRRIVRRVTLTVATPALLLSACLSSMQVVAAWDGAAMPSTRVRQSVPVADGPIIGCANESGLPGAAELEPWMLTAHEFGWSLR